MGFILFSMKKTTYKKIIIILFGILYTIVILLWFLQTKCLPNGMQEWQVYSGEYLVDKIKHCF